MGSYMGLPLLFDKIKSRSAVKQLFIMQLYTCDRKVP